jgi:hypothetical protein
MAGNKTNSHQTTNTGKKWHWIGHTLHKPHGAIERLDWNPQSTRKRGTPRTTWEGTKEKELQCRNELERGKGTILR